MKKEWKTPTMKNLQIISGNDILVQKLNIIQ